LREKTLSPEAIRQRITAAVTALLEDKTVAVTGSMPLIGDDSLLDSMKLVELCLALEDLAADLGFAFDWTSASAMSKSRSMFRTLDSLSAEFLAQMGTAA
jgi:acyl carrier protein